MEKVKYLVVVEAWSGNVKPWKAKVLVGDKQVAHTGFCKTNAAAGRLASTMAAKHAKEHGVVALVIYAN